MIEEIPASSGSLFEISDYDLPISEQISQFLSNNSTNTNTKTCSINSNNIYTIHNNNNNNNDFPLSQSHFLSSFCLNKEKFDLTKLSQHSQFRSSLHNHAHLSLSVVLPLYYSYTEALLSVIMGFSYSQFHLHQSNHPIKRFLDPITNQSSYNINIQNDRYIEEPYKFGSILCHGTMFKCVEKQNVIASSSSNNVYSAHILNLYNNPHQLIQLYVPPNRQPTPSMTVGAR